MIRLNLPSFDIKTRVVDGRGQVLDPLRRRWVASSLGYPQALLANEVQLNIGMKKLRADSVLYDRELHPKMIIEYKAPSIPITQKVFNQIMVYNLQLHAPYLVVSNGIKHYCCKLDNVGKKYLFLSAMPCYEEI